MAVDSSWTTELTSPYRTGSGATRPGEQFGQPRKPAVVGKQYFDSCNQFCLCLTKPIFLLTKLGLYQQTVLSDRQYYVVTNLSLTCSCNMHLG